jgi:predicted P-loop ATPase
MQSALQLPKMGLAAVERAALLVGDRQKRHPVKEWFDTLMWDGTERLPALLADGWGAEQNDYTRAVGINWLTAMVARVYDPGVKFDNIVIIEGVSGIMKSSSLRALVGDQWFIESSIDPVRKMNDFLQATQGAILMEIPEIDRYMRGDSIRSMVALAGMQEDIYRAPYSPTTMRYPRQCVICGTTNKSQLYDDTDGMRRWWPFIARELNLEYLKTNRKLLWAEAIVRYKRGEHFWEVPADSARAAQLDRRNRDEWEAIIERYMSYEPTRYRDQVGATWVMRAFPLTQATPAELLEYALGLDPGRWSRQDQLRVGAACR